MKKTPNKMDVQDPKIAELEALHNTKIYTIEGVNEAGEPLKMYIRKPEYKLKKAVMEVMMRDSTAVVTAGEMILAGCFVDGYNLYDDEDTRLEAAVTAAHLVQFNNTFTLKKS